ncbi:MAG: hypothetical protein ACT4OS_03260, partial [Acidimicrobiales bacterium]
TSGYDSADRLVAAGGSTYLYDGDGLRVARTGTSTTGAETTKFIWDRRGGLPRLLAETTPLGTIAYVHGPTAHW